MTIVLADLQFYKSAEVSTAATNGGLPSEDRATTGVKNNIWTNVSEAQRASGLDTYIKLFAIPRSDNSDDLVDPRLWNHSPTPGDDYVILFTGTKTDTEATLVETTFHVAGNLKTDLSIGDTDITVTVEDPALVTGFHVSGRIVISNKTSPELTTGDSEEITLNATAFTVSGSDVTMHTDVGVVAAYLASNSYVSSMLTPGDSTVSTGTVVITSTSGTVDESTFPIIVNNTGTKDESITVTFTSATTYTVAGSVSGNLGSGSVSATFTGVNPDNAKTCIEFTSGFFTGTYASLDTVVIPTISNATPLWLKRTVPALSDSLSGNTNLTGFKGEGA